MELKNKTMELEFKEVENTIDELLNEYGEKAAEIAKSPISIYETENLMSLQEEMSLKIFNTFEIDKYKTTGQYILKSSISANREKYIYKISISNGKYCIGGPGNYIPEENLLSSGKGVISDNCSN